MEILEKIMIRHHLHVSKHIVMLLNLTTDDLDLTDRSPGAKKVKKYLFNQLGITP